MSCAHEGISHDRDKGTWVCSFCKRELVMAHERRERIANDQMAALWVALSNTGTADASLTREDVAREALLRADILIAALDDEGGER